MEEEEAMMEESVPGTAEEEEDDEEMMTSAEVLAKLEEAWRNEKFAPDLLEAKPDLVDCIVEQLTAIEDNLARAKKGDIRIAIHRLELDRIRFVLVDYLRCRLKKIEANADYIIATEAERSDDETSHLSVEEFEFAKSYLTELKSHLNETVLQNCPKNMQSLKWRTVMPRPAVDTHVFFHVNEDVDDVVLEDGVDEVVEDMKRGSRYIARYKLVAGLVAEGKITLI